ncbi:hypothetical protein BD769DRAFT_1386614 [Suillus cothurnatus]|nr:hypothetical protein BD769DRAFT_1386614 [Suillus cothurnatus]
MSYGTEVVCVTHRGTLLKWYIIHSATLLGGKMPKRKAGHLSNLGGYATINTKRTKPVDLFLDAAKIIAQQESPLPPSIPALDKIFTTADCDHNSESNEPEGAVHDAENICGLEYDSCEDDCEGSLDEDGDIFEAEALEDGIESEQGVRRAHRAAQDLHGSFGKHLKS